MLFNSVEFLIFLPIVLAAYYMMRLRAQNLFLVGASYFFYGWWDWRFCGLLLFSTLLDYFCAVAMERPGARKRAFLWVSLVGNLGVLGFFKYFNFVNDSLRAVLGCLSIEYAASGLSILLPDEEQLMA